MKKLLFGASTSIVMLGAMIAPAFAGNSGTGAEYGTQPGYDVSFANSQSCVNSLTGTTDVSADHGAFGYYGKDHNLGVKSDPTDPGANGYKTGINNSTLCGNRQGNL